MNAPAKPRRDRHRTLITPEGIAVPLTLASRGTRFAALVIDLLVIVGSLLLLLTMVGFSAAGLARMIGDGAGRAASKNSGALEFLAIVLLAALFLLRHGYFMAFELGPRGATPGKRLTGVRVAARDGGQLRPEMVIARNLLRDIELFMPLVLVLQATNFEDGGMIGLVAAGWVLLFAGFPFFNADGLRAGDLIAGTWVVEAPKKKLAPALSTGAAAASGTSHATGAAYHFSDAELAVYGEFELQTLERVLREGRPEALAAVHEAICRKLGWSPGSGDEHAFLEAYYTQLRAKLEAGMRMGKRKADKFA